MKRAIALLMVIFMGVGLCGCGNGSGITIYTESEENAEWTKENVTKMNEAFRTMKFYDMDIDTFVNELSLSLSDYEVMDILDNTYSYGYEKTVFIIETDDIIHNLNVCYNKDKQVGNIEFFINGTDFNIESFLKIVSGIITILNPVVTEEYVSDTIRNELTKSENDYEVYPAELTFGDVNVLFQYKGYADFTKIE